MDRERGVRNVLVVTLFSNVTVSLAKMAYGLFTNSIAMTSDGFHSLFDGVSNVVGLLGVRIASHPPDREHPYGHRKYETLFTMLIATMIFLTCFGILRKVYESFAHDHRTIVTPVSFVVMFITMAVNVAVMRYEGRKGKELKSEFLVADAKHTRSDILTSLSVILGLAATASGYPRADAVVGIVVAVLIARLGYGILKSASDTLVDTVCINTVDIETVVMEIEGVRGTHDIRTRGTAHSTFLDLHVLVDPGISIERAHEIADGVERAIKRKFPSVVDVVVHTEPDDRMRRE